MIAQKALNKEIMAVERLLSCSQARQSVLDSTISSGKRTVTGEMKLIESETLDSTIASFFYENALAFQCFGVSGAVRHTRMRASAARRLSQLVYAHEHRTICRMVLLAASRVGAARVCAQAQRARHRAQAHRTRCGTRTTRGADTQVSTSPRVRPGQNSSGG